MPQPNNPTNDTIEALQELAVVLKSIYLRLKGEGFRFENGQLVAPAI